MISPQPCAALSLKNAGTDKATSQNPLSLTWTEQCQFYIEGCLGHRDSSLRLTLSMHPRNTSTTAKAIPILPD